MSLRLRRTVAFACPQETRPEHVQEVVQAEFSVWADPFLSWLQVPLAFHDPELEKKFIKKKSEDARMIIQFLGLSVALLQAFVIPQRIFLGQFEGLHPQLRLFVLLLGLMMVVMVVVLTVFYGYLKEPASRERLGNVVMPTCVTLILLQDTFRSAALLSFIYDDMWSASKNEALQNPSDEPSILFLSLAIIAYHTVPFARCRSKWPAVFIIPAIYLALTKEAPSHSSKCAIKSYEFQVVAVKAFGLALQSAIVFFTSCQVEMHVRKDLQNEQKMKSEQHVLKETHDTLHIMLSSLWDASCVCSSDGMVSSSTPHLDQLLAAGADLSGLSLCSFAADHSEVNRLQDFLCNTAMSTIHQASRVQCTMRPRALTDAAATASNGNERSCELILHAVRLPAGAVQREQSCTKAFVFIGIQGAVDNLPDAEDVFDCNSLQPSFTGGFHRDAGAASQREGREESPWELKSHAESSCAVSWDVTESSLAYSAGLTLSSASQVSTCPNRCFDMSVQTECPSTKSVHMQTSTLPPRSPCGSSSALGRVEQFFHRSRKKSCKLLPWRRQTPPSTILDFMQTSLPHFNVKGKAACCKYHTAVLGLHRASRTMFASKCDAGFDPHDGWQCVGCYAMNSLEEEDEEEDELQCTVCGSFGRRDKICPQGSTGAGVDYLRA